MPLFCYRRYLPDKVINYCHPSRRMSCVRKNHELSLPPFRPPIAKVIVPTDRFHGVLRHVHQRVLTVCVIIVLTRQVMTISRVCYSCYTCTTLPIKIPQIKSEYNHFILLSKKLQYTLFSLSLVVYPQILL